MSIWGAIASAYGTHQSNKNIDKQLAAQSAENQKMRAYNLQLAKLQNAWNLQQWQRENAYNAPSAQLSRMRAAGLNPDMMYGGGVEGNISASSPMMDSGAASSPVDWSALGSKRTIADTIMSSKQLEMMDAQIDKTKAEGENTSVQSQILKSDAAYRDAFNQGQIDLQNMQIRGIASDINVNEQQISESRAMTAKLNQEVVNLQENLSLIRSQVMNLDAQTASRRLHDILDSKEVDAKIRQMAADTNLSYEQAKAISQKTLWEVIGLQSQIEVDNATLQNINVRTDSVEFDLQQAKSWDDFERSLGSFTKITNGLSMVTGAIGLLLGGKSPKPIKGFR